MQPRLRTSSICISFLIAIALVSAGCKRRFKPLPATGHAPSPRRADADKFFAEWFRSHGHKDNVNDDVGVGVKGNATRLRASLYGSERQKDGGFVIEMEFTITLPSRRVITEFVAGTADTEEKAINDAMANFVLTTYHPIYKGFINADDPHMNVRPIEISGKKRQIIMGDIMTRGQKAAQAIDLNKMRSLIENVLKNMPLSDDSHWIKIVYGQQGGQPIDAVAVTVDNEEDRSLTDAIKRLDWPRTESFYMAKQFIVIK